MAKKYGRWETIIGSMPEGGQGHVYKVKDTTEEHTDTYILKRLKNEKRKELFEQEITATKTIEDAHILRIIDFDISGDKPYYVSEYCEKGSLVESGAKTYQGDIKEAARILIPISQALAKVHAKGIYHRDIKPANIFQRADGTPVLGDFGICRVEGGERFTLTDEAMGSINFIAPEMESGGKGPPTDKTDVYNLGKVLYWMLSGGRSFARENHRGTPLTEILRDQTWEHVHMLLDRVIVQNPPDRLSVPDFWMELIQLTSLIVGKFAPLKPSLGILCRFCGIGTYKPHTDNSSDGMMRLISAAFVPSGPPPGIPVRVLICQKCGHLELFNTGQAEIWWKA